MKLNVLFAPGAKSLVYRPGDVVSGAVTIENHVFKEPPSVTATFQGTDKKRLRALAHTCREAAVYRAFWKHAPKDRDITNTNPTLQLFEQSQKLEATSKVPLITDNEENKCFNESTGPCYSTPFRFIFPTSSSRCSCQLPPSLHKTSTYLRVKTEYTVIVTVRYRTFCQIQRSKKIRRELLFRSEPRIEHLKPSAIGCLPANTLLGKTSSSSEGSYGGSSVYQGWLPPYTPSLQLEFSFPSSLIIEKSRIPPIRLTLHTPPEILEISVLHLRSISVQLRSSVAVLFGSPPFELVEDSQCWSSKGVVRIDRECLELDSGSWARCVVAKVLPTCFSCLMELKHSIEVTAGISKDDDVNDTNVSIVYQSIPGCARYGPATYIQLRVANIYDLTGLGWRGDSVRIESSLSCKSVV
ncbi:hypothetical protein IF1G_06341 [Cordyceps javanica]|uniref:Arrestin-like N-terminal domain-containing protein n=1 Tax=Cordyceps javanica TaxID=43265 RepID=A0A545V0W1_9HYPO|nr:hypothetical protein IF1G_06341 [Cordyceps javanica]